MRLIDADEILKKCNWGNCWYIPREAIEDEPTIDAEPVKHGEWVKGYRKTANGVDFLVLSCSECDNADPQMNYYNYCPNCGAKMKGQEE